MELYKQASQQAAENLTKSYSTSFSMAVRLVDQPIRRHVYNIYGLVRVADEIVDSYAGTDSDYQLDQLESEVYSALKTGYSSNIIVQAFVLTADKYGINKDLIKPFFASMRVDIDQKVFNQKQYNQYIYGSAEVVGLMCLKVFCPSAKDYLRLSSGARALGAAFQKINFLRDISADWHNLGRCYFPGTTFDTFDKAAKDSIIKDISRDIDAANKSLRALPKSSRPAVGLALGYYNALLKKLVKASPEEIKTKRYRVSDGYKLMLFIDSWFKAQISRGRR